MKILSIFLLASFSLMANATELVPMHGTAVFSCEKKFDVINSKAKNIFSLENPIVTETENDIIIDVEIKFFHCDIENGEYVFSSIENHMTANYSYPDFTTGQTITATRYDKMKNLVAHGSRYSYESKSEIKTINSRHFAKIVVSKSDIEVNNFPMAQEKGNFFTTLVLRTQSKVVTPTIDLGYSVKSTGSHRLFLDLKQ